MTETAITFLETSVFIIVLGFSIGVAFRFHADAKAHEKRVKNLGKQVKRALNM